MTGSALANDSIKIIINKKVNKLAYIKNGSVLRIFPVATGRSKELTPEGSFKVVRKLVKPYYTKGKIPVGSPRNPLGVRWLGINARGTTGGTYGIHGTNNPKSIGKYASGGCIRMYNEDVIWLYNNTPMNIPVDIINRAWDLETKPVKITVVVDGKTLFPGSDGQAYMIRNRVMAPGRFVAEALGCAVSWDNVKRQVVLKKGERVLVAKVNSKEIFIDGVRQDLKEAVAFNNSRVYLPVRDVAEFAGYGVAWNNSSHTVSLAKAIPVLQEISPWPVSSLN